MTGWAKIAIHFALTALLTFALALSSNFPSSSHNSLALTAIAAQHEAEKAEHGHSHEESDSLAHVFYGHVHDATDHDHNVAFLTSREASKHSVVNSLRWRTAGDGTRQGPAFNLDRPPRG